MFQWIKRQGGLAAMERHNRAKAEKLYGAIDGSGFYRNPVALDARSWMNVPFTLPSDELDKPFLEGAKAAGLVDAEGAPLRRRHAGQHLQRDADGRRRGAGAVSWARFEQRRHRP